MKKDQKTSGCACCPMNRREFLARGCAAAIGAMTLPAIPTFAGAGNPDARMRIRIIHALHGETQTIPDWPNKGFDFRPVMRRIGTALADRCKSFEFVTSTAAGAEQAGEILEKDKSAGVDGYVVFQMNCWNQVVQTVATSGRPVLYVDFQFAGSGGFLVYTAGFLRSKAPNIGFVASSDIDDLVEAVKCFGLVGKGAPAADFAAATANLRGARTRGTGDPTCRPDHLTCLSSAETLRRLKATKILAVRGEEPGPPEEFMGIRVVYIPFAEVNDAWEKADRDEACAVADQWQKRAAIVNGVSRETLEDSAAMYLAERAVLKTHDAGAITINCLGGFYGKHIHAYPCLGFHQLLNEGLVGGCECDVRSAVTMVVGTVLTQGRPGYISDPVLDTAKRQIIYAHCVASNRAFGPKGEENPFEILTHSEDRQGASVRSLLPPGYMTTSLEFDQSKKEILFHRAITVGNDPDDRACRTKLCAEPLGDFEKLFRAWDQWGWHRVTFYGDLKEPVFGLADALGWKVIEEA